MSTYEYTDLYFNCQNKLSAKYHVFTYDIVNSKSLSKNDLVRSEMLLQKIILEMYKLLSEKELNEDRHILIKDLTLKKMSTAVSPGEFGYKYEPFQYSDMVGITIYRNSMTKEAMNNLFNSLKEKAGLTCDIHYSDGYYETNDYNNADKKYFRGYCIDYLSNKTK